VRQSPMVAVIRRWWSVRAPLAQRRLPERRLPERRLPERRLPDCTICRWNQTRACGFSVPSGQALREQQGQQPKVLSLGFAGWMPSLTLAGERSRMHIPSTPISNPDVNLLAEAKRSTQQQAQAHKMARGQANRLTAEQKLRLIENLGNSTASVTNKKTEKFHVQDFLQRLFKFGDVSKKNGPNLPRFRTRTPDAKGLSLFSKQKSGKSGLSPRLKMLAGELQAYRDSRTRAENLLSHVKSTPQLALVCQHLDDRTLASDSVKKAFFGRLCQLEAKGCYNHLANTKNFQDQLPNTLMQQRMFSDAFRDSPYVNDQANFIKNLLMLEAPCAVLMRLQQCERNDFAITPQEFEASGVTASLKKEIKQYDGMALQQLHTQLSGQLQSYFEHANPAKARSLALHTQTIITTGDQLEELLIQKMRPGHQEAFRDQAAADRAQACIDKLFLNANSIEAVAARADGIQARLDQASGNSPAAAVEQFLGAHAVEQDARTLIRIRTGRELPTREELSAASQDLLNRETRHLAQGIEAKAQQLGNSDDGDQAVHDGRGEAERDKLLALAQRFYTLARQLETT